MSSSPAVDTQFTGDERILKSTQSPYMAVRRALVALQQHLARVEDQPIHVTAEIKLHGIQGCTQENGYYTTITDAEHDASALNSPQAGTDYPQAPVDAEASPSAPSVLGYAGRTTRTTRRLTNHEYREDSHDDTIERRPLKKARLSMDDGSSLSTRSNEVEASPTRAVDELRTTIQNWQREWKAQGGWLYDTLGHFGTVAQQNATGLQAQLNEVQDTIGESINAANASNLSEFEAIKRLIPWLEQCRKAEADRVRSGEENWRTSSATFQHQSQQAREATQKRLEDGLNKQGRMLLRIAEAVGVNLDDIND